MIKVVLAIVALMMTACGNKTAEGGGNDSTATAETAVAAGQEVPQLKTDTAFDVKKLVMALKHYEDYELLDGIGLKLIYEDSYQNEEMEEMEVMYGKDIVKGSKEEPIGYALKTTSDHAFYYSMALDTSTRPNLGFVNQKDALSFIENTLKTEPFGYEGMTYYIHPKERDGERYIHIETPYGSDDFETCYVLYPLRQDNGFWRIEIEYYV